MYYFSSVYNLFFKGYEACMSLYLCCFVSSKLMQVSLPCFEYKEKGVLIKRL